MNKKDLINSSVEYILEAIPAEAYDLMREKLSAKDFEEILLDGYVIPFLKECMDVSRAVLETLGTRESEIILQTIDVLDVSSENLCEELKK